MAGLGAAGWTSQRAQKHGTEPEEREPGLDGDRTMMLVYNLPSVADIHQRFVGVDGSAYLVAGFAMTALTANDIVIVPIRSGVGARLGINVSYLKFTETSTWNPF